MSSPLASGPSQGQGSNPALRPPNRRNIRVAAFVVFALLFGMHVSRDLQKARQRLALDSANNLVLAFNLRHHRTFSMQCPGAKHPLACTVPTDTVKSGSSSAQPNVGQVRPTAYREPLYPALLALGIWLHPGLRSLTAEEFFGGDRLPVHPKVHWILVGHVALLLLSALAVMALVKGATQSDVLSFAGLYAVGLSPGIGGLLSHYQPEILVAALLLGFSWLLMTAVRRARLSTFVLAGLTLGALSLTRATYAYLLPVITTGLVILSWKDRTRRQSLLLGTAALIVAALLVIAPWMWRNYLTLGRAYIADRGGVVLKIRAEYDAMRADEYLASFLYWTPGTIGRRLLDRYVAREHWARLDRHNPDGFYMRGRLRRQQTRDLYGDASKADAVLLAEAKAAILSRPVRHLLVSIPMALQGIYVERWIPLVLNPLLFVATFWLFWGAFKSDGGVCAFLLPAITSFAFYTLATHSLPRYNVPLLPILWAGTLIAAHQIRTPALWRARRAH